LDIRWSRLTAIFNSKITDHSAIIFI